MLFVSESFSVKISMKYKIKAAAIQDTELYLGEYAIAESLAEGVESPTVLGAKIAKFTFGY